MHRHDPSRTDSREVSERKVRIVGVGGSLATISKSRVALRLALAGAEGAGGEVELLDLRELSLPMYDPDDEQEPGEAASRLIESCYAADGLIWSTPLYPGTISSALQNGPDLPPALGSRDPSYLEAKVITLTSPAGAARAVGQEPPRDHAV